jgi:hypothetical protein
VPYIRDRNYTVGSLIAQDCPDAFDDVWTAQLAGALVTVDRLQLSGGPSLRQPRSMMTATDRLHAATPNLPPGAVESIRAVVVLKVANPRLTPAEAVRRREEVYGTSDVADGLTDVLARPSWCCLTIFRP